MANKRKLSFSPKWEKQSNPAKRARKGDFTANKNKKGGPPQKYGKKNGGSPANRPHVQQKQQQPAKKFAVPSKKEQLKFEDSDEDDEELSDEELEDEELESDKEDEQKTITKKQQQPAKKLAVPSKKEQLKFEESDEEDEELSDEDLEDEELESDKEDEPMTITKKQQQQLAQKKLAVPSKKEQLKFEDSDEEDEELSDEEMEDEELESDKEDEQKTVSKKGAPNKAILAEEERRRSEKDTKTKKGAPNKAILAEEERRRPEKDTMTKKGAPNKAILSEEERRRSERDKVTLFLRCEMLHKMTEHEIKALHPDTLAVRTNNKGFCWLVFASEPTAEKAFTVLSKKGQIGGKELYVDRCGSKAKKQHPGVKDKVKEHPVNPTELVIYHFPSSTTTEQLKVVFPAAKNVKIASNEGGKNIKNFKRASRATITFGNEADAKKAFDKSAQMKIGGVPVDVFYARS